MGKTLIEWATHTENFVAGCSKVSRACDHCYALSMSRRLASMSKKPKRYDGVTVKTPAGFDWTGLINVDRDAMIDCFERYSHRREPARIFLGSMTDLFHAGVPRAFLFELLDLIAASPRHAWLILTKRPSRMARIIFDWMTARLRAEPLPNLWTGTTIESQTTAATRVPALLEVPSACRFVSCEPLTSALDIVDFDDNMPGIHWVIAGGESGPKAEASHPDWFRGLRDQCADAGVAFHFKQWGEYGPVNPDRRDPDTGGDVELDPDTRDGRSTWVAGKSLGLSHDGQAVKGLQHMTPGVLYTHMQRVGKKLAGRDLDGRTWDELPAAWPPVAP